MWQKGHELQGQYRIEKKLGEGCFGITYKAKHILLADWVVIKTPNATSKGDPEYAKFVKQFHKKALTLHQLGQARHPHIVRVSNFFLEGDLPCLVMDFIEGEDLYQRVQRKGALPEEEVVGYIRQIGSALNLIHSYQLVHRDATPLNIMLPQPGEAILIDFGIMGEISPTQMSSKAMGNRAFASNEQLRGTGRKPTVDIYTLAASCYYGVSGRVPQFNDDEELILPQQLNPRISDTLNQAIARGMARLAKNRPQTMASWLELLESIPTGSYSPPSSTPVIAPTIPSVPPPQAKTIPVLQEKRSVRSKKRRKKKKRKILEDLKQLPWFWLLIILEGCAVAGFLSGTVERGLVVAVIMAVVAAVAGAVVGDIFKSMNQYQGALIALGTAVIGFGLGWLLSLL